MTEHPIKVYSVAEHGQPTGRCFFSPYKDELLEFWCDLPFKRNWWPDYEPLADEMYYIYTKDLPEIPTLVEA